MEYYDRIRYLREDRDLKQKDIAKILNSNQRRISRIETGTCEITVKELKAICEYYKVSADFILDIRFD